MSKRLRVAVDAMGGDHAPMSVISGTKQAIEQSGVPVLLVGDPTQIADGLDGFTSPLLEVRSASQVVPMGSEPASAVRRLKDSSIVRAVEAVRDGDAAVALSAGNTGGAMAASLLRYGRIKGVARPAIVIPFPVLGSTPTVLLDAGANPDCQPDLLLQFAVLGASYVRFRYDVAVPKVGLLTIGEEAGKGNSLAKSAAELLADPKWSEIAKVHYVGNVEANELMTGAVDVLVTDGFTGNVVLKVLEGFSRISEQSMRAALTAVPEVAESATAVLDPLWTTFDANATGSAVLLGTRRVTMISHGSASPDSLANAIETASSLDVEGLVANLREAVTART